MVKCSKVEERSLLKIGSKGVQESEICLNAELPGRLRSSTFLAALNSVPIMPIRSKKHLNAYFGLSLVSGLLLMRFRFFANSQSIEIKVL
jgi:hypothetical protein